MKTKNMKTPHLEKKSIDAAPLRRGFLLIPLGLAWLALSPVARAVCQDGCDPSHASTFLGDDALINSTTGDFNTAIGGVALYSNTSGEANVAIGNGALYNNTSGDHNTATGVQALYGNTFGDGNTASGSVALHINTTGSDNTALGFEALNKNTTGNNNTATGASALYTNTGSGNTATGFNALYSNTTGVANTASGFQALYNNTSGNYNIAIGLVAGANLTTGDNNIYIGNTGGGPSESNTIHIGTAQRDPGGNLLTRTYIAGIRGRALRSGIPVFIDPEGQLGTVTSSARFKDGIKAMDKASEVILALKPVSFRYKKEIDPDGIPQFGLVAEEVEKVNPDLVVRDQDGKPYTVRYEAVNAMLLNEFLKEHRKVEQLTKDFESKVAEQQKQIEALTAGLQKVSAQLEPGSMRNWIAVNTIQQSNLNKK
jgi:hypothetical protein